MKYIVTIMFLAILLFAKININTATIKELSSLKGIGEVKASLIIKYRQQHPFKKIEDIMKVKGIGIKTFDKIKDKIEVKENK